MRVFAHICIAESGGNWAACFKTSPYQSFGGPNPTIAIQRLLDAADAEFDVDSLIDLEDQARDGHMEFLIPCRGRWMIPNPSLN